MHPRTINRTSGFTLFETLLSLVLLSLLAGVSYPLFSTAKTLLSNHRNREEVVQNGRVVLRRLVKETRYATSIYTASANTLEMGSQYLIDGDSGEERVRYRLQGESLSRAVDTGGGYGTDVVMAEKVSTFNASYDSAAKTVTLTISVSYNGKSYSDGSQVRPRSL